VDTIGGFELTSVLGDGPAGDLAAARGPDGAAALVRIYPADRCTDPAAVQRCLADAGAASAVGHPGIARVVASGQHDGRAFVAFADGGDGAGAVATLAAHARTAGRMSATQVAVLARQIADALAAAHTRGLVHRDLRPSRVVVTTDADGVPTVRILDFGSARLEPTPATEDAARYAAPERWTNPAQVDPRADVYALGCIAFELACGQPPFHGTLDELRARQLSEPPPPARSLMPDLPPGVEHLLGKMLAKQPSERPKSIGEVARAFEVLGGGTLSAAPLATTDAFQAVAPPVLHGPAIADVPGAPRSDVPGPEPATPPELYTRVGEIGEAQQMSSPPPAASMTVAVSSAFAAQAAATDGAAATMVTRAVKGPPTILVIVIAVVAIAVVAAIFVMR
jgi:serine/threonine protein kinase